MKSKNQKILESFDLSKVSKDSYDEKILSKMLSELVTSGIRFTDADNISSQDINKLAQIFPTYFKK